MVASDRTIIEALRSEIRSFRVEAFHEESGSCIEGWFYALLAIANDFPDQIGEESAATWAKAIAAGVMTESMKEPFSEPLPELLATLDEIVDWELFQTQSDDSVFTHSPDYDSAFTHSPDYRSIRFKGTDYTLTLNQATMIKMLHEAFQQGTPHVGKLRLLAAVGAETSRVQDSFKVSPLWQTLVVSGERRGTYRLNLFAHS